LPPHPSIPQSFNALFPLEQAEQIILLFKRVAPHPQAARWKHIRFRWQESARIQLGRVQEDSF
jgi:hypothetical protein